MMKNCWVKSDSPRGIFNGEKTRMCEDCEQVHWKNVPKKERIITGEKCVWSMRTVGVFEIYGR